MWNRAHTTVVNQTQFDLLPKLIIQSDKELKSGFVNLTKENYPMDVYKINTLTSDTMRSETKKINDWFGEKSTSKQVGKMLDDNSLSTNVNLMLLSGAAFKGVWRGQPFNVNDTKDEDFYNADGKSSKIMFMCAEEKQLRLVREEDQKIEAIEIPFNDHEDTDGHKHRSKLIIVTSLGNETIDKTIENLTYGNLIKLLKKLSTAELIKAENFKLPKLYFEKGKSSYLKLFKFK